MLCCAAILQKKEGYMYGHEYVWTYFVYNYILVSPRLLRTTISLFLFSILIF